MDLYESVARLPLVSVHNGLPARYLAEDLPITDPISLLISHDQGIQALLRSSGIRTEFAGTDGWRTEHESRQALVLLWTHLVDVWSRPWMQPDGDETARLAGLPTFRDHQTPDVYDALAVGPSCFLRLERSLLDHGVRCRVRAHAQGTSVAELGRDPADVLGRTETQPARSGQDPRDRRRRHPPARATS